MVEIRPTMSSPKRSAPYQPIGDVSRSEKLTRSISPRIHRSLSDTIQPPDRQNAWIQAQLKELNDTQREQTKVIQQLMVGQSDTVTQANVLVTELKNLFGNVTDKQAELCQSSRMLTEEVKNTQQWVSGLKDKEEEHIMSGKENYGYARNR